MKLIAVIFLSVLLLITTAQSQSLRLAPVIEKTVAGTQYGSLLQFQTKKKWSLGAFYQTSILKQSEGFQLSDSFYGLTVNAPLSKSSKLNFYFNLRGGVVNQIFVVVAPGLETEMQLTKSISVSALMSIRMSYPSAGVKIYIKI